MRIVRDYQRKHLRAPFKKEILFGANDFVFKAHTLNISEGGMLLDQIPYFPDNDLVPMMIGLPQYPYFKNFDLHKLKSYSAELFKAKIIRARCKVVRKVTTKSKAEDVFTSRVGVQFIEVAPTAQKIIADYVDVFSSNLIYLQLLIDNINSYDDSLERVRTLANILHYPYDMKIAQMRKDVTHDYQSLQWN